MRLKSAVLMPLCLLLALLSYLPVSRAAADDAPLKWDELSRPGAPKGLLMEPRLLGFGSRLHLIWIGTNEQVTKPEFFHSSISDGSSEWTSPRPPFFGQNKSRVRRLAIGRSKSLIAILIERTLTQGNDAYEVLMSLSGDQGWSWGKLNEIDQFVSDVKGGTALSIEGGDGPNRTEFAMAWSRDFGTVRMASINIKTSLRPEGVAVGAHSDNAMKVEVGSLGRDGFTSIFNTGQGLASGHARPLNGKITEATTFLRGQYGEFFSLASSPYGPSKLVVGNAGTLKGYTSDGTGWKAEEQVAILPFSSSGVIAESDMDSDKNLHVAMLVPKDKGGYQLWYIGQSQGRWNKPEVVCELSDDSEVRGFDIAVTDKSVALAISQGFKAKFFRKKLIK